MNVTTRISQNYGEVFASQRETSLKLRSSTVAQRIAKLKKLEAAVLAHRGEIYRALMEDLHKAEAETDLA
jgi:aldehyde dehydrogenase (NAD+)